MREYDLLSQEFYANPYPILAEMRREDPCWYDARLKAFVTTRYQDVKRVLRDGNDFSSQRVAQFVNGAPAHLEEKVDAYVDELSRWLMFLDPPNHTVLRSRLLQSFGPRFLPLVAAEAEKATTEALDKMEATSSADLINDFAYPVPTQVLARVLGISDADIERFKEWTTDVFTLIGAGVADDEAVETGYRGMTELREYVLELLSQKRRSPAEDVLSALANPAPGEPADTLVPDRDIAGLFMALIIAGHEAMTGLIGNGLYGILNDSRCRDWILNRADFPETAVDELLRYDCPILSIMRRAKRDVVVAGQFVPEGAFIFNVLNAGNRDPRQFSDPDRLDFDRPAPAHVGLGVGMHQCVGAPMTKVVVREAIPRLVRRFPNVAIASGCVWLQNISIRGLLAMPVVLHGSQFANA